MFSPGVTTFGFTPSSQLGPQLVNEFARYPPVSLFSSSSRWMSVSLLAGMLTVTTAFCSSKDSHRSAT
jgi:hypothetical protein